MWEDTHCKAKMLTACCSCPSPPEPRCPGSYPPTQMPAMAQSRISGGKCSYLFAGVLQSAPRKLWKSSKAAAAPLRSLDAGEHRDGKRENMLRKIKESFTQRFRATDLPCPITHRCKPSFSRPLFSKKARKEVKAKSPNLFHWTQTSAARDEGPTDVQTLCKFLGRFF